MIKRVFYGTVAAIFLLSWFLDNANGNIGLALCWFAGFVGVMLLLIHDLLRGQRD